MKDPTHRFSFLLLGEQSLLVQCAELLHTRGHEVRCIVTEDVRITQWAEAAKIPCLPKFEALRQSIPGGAFDYLFSITNLRMLPAWLLDLPRRGAVNFHDGPLPRYAGLNAPVWALLNAEPEHGVTWHEITAGADRGRILATRHFEVAANETVFGLNAQCYQAAMESFAELLGQVEEESLQPREQDFSRRSYFGLADRPPMAATLDWQRPAEDNARLVRALDFGRYPNPVLLPKIDLGGTLRLARAVAVVPADASVPVGAIQSIGDHSFTVRCAEGALEVLRLSLPDGDDSCPVATLRELGLGIGAGLPLVRGDALLDARVRQLATHEGWWLRQLRGLELSAPPFMQRAGLGAPAWLSLKSSGEPRSPESLIASLLLLVARLNGRTRAEVAFAPRSLLGFSGLERQHAGGLSVVGEEFDPQESYESWQARIVEQLARVETRVGWLIDLPARQPDLRDAFAAIQTAALRIVRRATLPSGVEDLPVDGSALTLVVADSGETAAWIDGQRMTPASFARFEACWLAMQRRLSDTDQPCGDVSVLSDDDAALLARWGQPLAGDVDVRRLEEQFEAQVRQDPARCACRFEGRSLSYGELNAAANRLARHLQSLGVRRGDLVGVSVPRSIEMLVTLQAVHKAGAAYVPLDPTYPEDRLAFMAEDARLRVVVSRSDVASQLPVPTRIDVDRIGAELALLQDTNLEVTGEPSDLAYVIYTSGSTGKPKGVMVEHRNVANFFAGIDERIGADPGVWLAVTSISFDISVLELFWTLCRGFTIVLHGDALRLKGKGSVPAQQLPSSRGARKPIDFGFFYWNVAKNEEDYDPEKYRLLLESARYADSHGFNAVWTPERHFAAFGGLFPNPAVTSAALATITKNVQLRAGSCVVPLHSPIRIAEEWAVVDNLSNGRVGMSVAAGWAPPDFAIKPENFANAKQVMFEYTQIVKRLWRGESVNFPGPKGGEIAVRTLPRPVQKELPIWVTTAGNIETYIEAGRTGANLLTHLLGQTVEEVAEKVIAYRKAWSDAGHTGRGTVTLMLHTLVGPDADAIEKIVRQPLKDYLRSAVFLVKAAAWQFPTFKKLSDEQGRTLDDFFANISEQDMDDLLEFAFQRYFRTSGLFGTPEQCLETVARVEGADVDEIACLIDFGIRTDTVLEHLPYLDRLRGLAQQGVAARDDFSLADLLRGERVTHLQCTPTMATMLAADPDSQLGLANLQHLMVGGESLPPDLARTLSGLVRGRVSNMYGPTETTIWSTVGKVDTDAITTTNSVSIGTPLLNQSVRILDEWQQPLPPGLVGEIVIGGAGVTRGYWQRRELTTERFPAGTAYRTGDLGRFLPDGRIECLGRRDHQVKIRGYRVELGEIEALLREQSDVAEAAVVLREDSPGDQRLVGYVRPENAGALDVESLRAKLGLSLPDFMVPGTIILLAELPTTPNGKIDRKALPAPRSLAVSARETGSGSISTVQPGSTATEAVILEIWKRTLGVAEIGLRENFFDIGGHSLLVIQVLKELREKTEKPIQMTDLFRHTTIESLARYLDGNAPSDESTQRGRSRADARRAAMRRRG